MLGIATTAANLHPGLLQRPLRQLPQILRQHGVPRRLVQPCVLRRRRDVRCAVLARLRTHLRCRGGEDSAVRGERREREEQADDPMRER